MKKEKEDVNNQNTEFSVMWIIWSSSVFKVKTGLTLAGWL
jgi:hypothetical protein